jgi:hypothetical protein
MDDNGVKRVSSAADRATGRSGQARSARPRRAVPLAVPLAGLVAAAPGLAACGSGTYGSNAGGTASTNVPPAKALAYARCMRVHGLTSFPEPVAAPGGGSSFHMRVTPGSSLNPDSPRFQAANAACEAFSPFDGLTPAQQAVANAKALRYSRCMRSHGIGSYPDPNGQGTIQVASGPGWHQRVRPDGPMISRRRESPTFTKVNAATERLGPHAGHLDQRRSRHE